MSVTVACDKCTKTFTKKNQLNADAALRMHKARKHDGVMLTPFEAGGKRTAAQIKRAKQNKAYRKASKLLKLQEAENGAGKKGRRPYTRRKKEPVTMEIPFHYCPGCTFPLGELFEAWQMLKAMKPKT